MLEAIHIGLESSNLLAVASIPNMNRLQHNRNVLQPTSGGLQAGGHSSNIIGMSSGLLALAIHISLEANMNRLQHNGGDSYWLGGHR